MGRRNKRDWIAFQCMILIMLATSNSFAQKAELQLTDSSKLATRLKYYSEEHLHTSAGAIPYVSIFSVRFNSRDSLKADFFLDALAEQKIKVKFDDAPIVVTNYTPSGTPRLSDSLRVAAETPPMKAIIGLGVGLDYGGGGARVAVPLSKQFYVFGGLGYALAGLGYNGGVMFIAKPDADLSFTMSAMYGYNASLVVNVNPNDNRLFYGPSAAAGLRYLVGRQRVNFMHFSVIAPFRDFGSANLYDASFLPVLISVGVNFGIRK